MPRRTMKEWFAKVYDVQTSQMDPEALRRCREQAERSRQLQTTSLQTQCVAQRATETLYRGKRAATKAKQSEEESSSELRVLSARNESYAANWHDPASLRMVMQQNRMADHADRLEVEGNDDGVGGAGGDEAVAAADVAGLLEQLRVEPTNDAELSAKFQLYETFASSVTDLRGSLEETAQRAATLLPPAPLAAVRSELKSLDRAALNGVEDPHPHARSNVWIVHGMVRVGADNLTLMQKMSKSWSVKMDLCAQNAQTACPVCLDDFSEELEKEVLGCCHAVCKECWATWSELQKKAGLLVFCPLCKQEHFANRLIEVRERNEL